MLAALARARSEAGGGGTELASSRQRTQVSPAVTARLRVRNMPSAGDPVYRNGVPYYDEWTIRAGATRLRIPAYPSWRRVKPESEFFQQQAQTAIPGEHLASVLVDNGFREHARTRYASFYTSIWVPQEHAFELMSPESFATFKTELQEETVEARKRLIDREDFLDFDDYLNFKFGYDEKVNEFVDGFWMRAVDEEDVVVYFATSQFVYQTSREEIVDPMIMTIAYALVENKLLRVDMRRLYKGEDDIAALIAYAKLFVEDMRKLNTLSEEARTFR